MSEDDSGNEDHASRKPRSSSDGLSSPTGYDYYHYKTLFCAALCGLSGVKDLYIICPSFPRIQLCHVNSLSGESIKRLCV